MCDVLVLLKARLAAQRIAPSRTVQMIALQLNRGERGSAFRQVYHRGVSAGGIRQGHDASRMEEMVGRKGWPAADR